MRTFKEIYGALGTPEIIAESTADILSTLIKSHTDSDTNKVCLSRTELSSALHKAFVLGQDDVNNRMKGSK